MSYPRGGVGFTNPIAGSGGVLIIPTLHSKDFGVDADGIVQGWELNSNGTATFYSITVGSPLFSIDGATGNASFQELNVASGDISLNGEALLGTILAKKAQGIVALAQLKVASSATVGTTELGVLELGATFVDGRMYRIATSTIIIKGTIAGDDFRLGIRDGLTASPSTSSNLIEVGAVDIFTAASDRPNMQFNLIVSCDSTKTFDNFTNFDIGLHRFLLSLVRLAGTGTATMSTGGGLYSPISFYVEDLGVIVQDTGILINGAGGATGGTGTFITVFDSTWGLSYRGTGVSCGADNSKFWQSNSIYQGQYSSCNGNTRGWIGFDFAAIQAALAGATLVKCEVYLYFNHWYANSGGTAVIGTHNSTFNGFGDDGPTFNGGLDNNNRLTVANWPKPAGKWVDLGLTIGAEFQAGTTNGIVIGPGNSSSTLYYGHIDDVLADHSPQMRFTYVV